MNDTNEKNLDAMFNECKMAFSALKKSEYTDIYSRNIFLNNCISFFLKVTEDNADFIFESKNKKKKD